MEIINKPSTGTTRREERGPEIFNLMCININEHVPVYFGLILPRSFIPPNFLLRNGIAKFDAIWPYGQKLMRYGFLS